MHLSVEGVFGLLQCEAWHRFSQTNTEAPVKSEPVLPAVIVTARSFWAHGLHHCQWISSFQRLSFIWFNVPEDIQSELKPNWYNWPSSSLTHSHLVCLGDSRTHTWTKVQGSPGTEAVCERGAITSMILVSLNKSVGSEKTKKCPLATHCVYMTLEKVE